MTNCRPDLISCCRAGQGRYIYNIVLSLRSVCVGWAENVCFKSQTIQVSLEEKHAASLFLLLAVTNCTVQCSVRSGAIVCRALLFFTFIFQQFLDNYLCTVPCQSVSFQYKPRARSCSWKTALILVQLSLTNKESGLSQSETGETAAGSTQTVLRVFIHS